jgi:SAM-dependent methyltransferase
VSAYDGASFRDLSHPRVSEVLFRSGNGQPELATPAPARGSETPSLPPMEAILSEITLGKRRLGDYDALAYSRYETAGPADTAKKVLEAALMEEVLEKDLQKRSISRRALDIGCATGRWPVWLAQRGFEAHGYDISRTAMEACETRAQRYPQLDLRFSRHNIIDEALEYNYFGLVTCMMGTFNHVAPEEREPFLLHVAETLEAGGLFVFSFWNVVSPYCEFLELDGQRARDSLRQNAISKEELELLLETSGLRLCRTQPFCLLPNQCYNVWEEDLSDIDLITKVDYFLRSVLRDGHPQMYFCVVEQPRRE